MTTENTTQRTSLKFSPEYYISIWVESFLIDRRAQNLSPGTVIFYRIKLEKFTAFCDGQGVKSLDQVDAQLVRRFIFWLEEQGHNPGGIHAHYRSVKALIRFWAAEVEPEGWRDPFRRVKPPRVPEEPLAPAEQAVIMKMLESCGRDPLGLRDRAIMLTLLDTGVRAAELIDLDVEDVDLATGAVLVRRGKGRKPRTVYLGKAARKAVRSWLRACAQASAALFTSQGGDRLAYGGLRAIITRRAKLAGVDPPTLHSFRRAFCLAMLRAGVDVMSLQRLMGHTSLAVLRRYLAQTEGDLAEAHRRASPADSLVGQR